MDPNSVFQPPEKTKLRKWLDGNWSDLPSTWWLKTRGGYLLWMVSSFFASVVFMLLCMKSVRLSLGEEVYGPLLRDMYIFLGMLFALSIPGVVTVARLWTRHQRKKNHE